MQTGETLAARILYRRNSYT